ncbi:uncharacterized protein LOC135681251 isoform X2 [Rhopilema esculentum]
MVFMNSTKNNETAVIPNTSEGIFTDSDIHDILKPSKSDPGNKNTSSPALLVNGSTSPKRLSRSSRESVGSSCSEGQLELNKSSSSLSPLPKLLESLSPAERASMTRPQIVAQEILITERIYVRDLQEVIEGYLIHLLHHGMTDVDIETIFGNLEEIYDFNKGILEDLEKIEDSRDPVLISQCFLNKAHGFNSLYVQYCTNYPESAAFLTEILKDKEISDFFAERQKASGHTLPIDSYLMKPVQRILKYHLLFKDMAKHFRQEEDGYEIVLTAAATMTDVAEYINEVKRLHENALRVQEILGSIEDLEGLDVFTTGRLVLENCFRVHGSRGEKQLYLFEKLLLICKKMDEGMFQFRDGLSCSNMMLVESIPKEPLCFQLIRFDNQKISYTIQAKNVDIKRDWMMQLKRLILETHSAMIPNTAREAILGRSENVRESKYSSINLQALDDTRIHWRRQRPLSNSGKENHHKDRSSLLVGVKRESVLKEDSTNIPKKTLNTKAKEFLDKQTKETAEKVKAWKLKRSKPRKADGNTSFENELPGKKSMPPAREVLPPSAMVKSRSLESLRDAISSSQEEVTSNSNIPAENEKSQEASEQIRRLSILHDLVSIETPDSEADNKQNADEAQDTPRSVRELRRKHASKSVYIDSADDPIRPGDLKRSRPVSLPPGVTLEDANQIVNFYETDFDTLERTCNELRKYGLTRTRSFNRKHRVGSVNLSESTHSVSAPKDDSDKRTPPANENEADKFEMLEKRLSIISDDENTTSCIKNTLRKVSQAFSSYGSEHALDTMRAPSTSTSSLTADIDAFLAQDDVWKYNSHPRSKRRSLGSIISETINPSVHSSLDDAKKRAFSTSVINEVSLDTMEEELSITEQTIERNLSALERDSAISVKQRINAYATKLRNESSMENIEEISRVQQRRSSDVSEMSLDSQYSNEAIEFAASRLSPMELAAGSDGGTKDNELCEGVSTNQSVLVLPASKGNCNESAIASTDDIAEDESDVTIPKRPAAPSSLNYVRSFAASIRRYRKNNVEIKESKSVYERIREYTALVSKEKNEQKVKTMDEMLESLDSANLPVSEKYIYNRRKFTRMVSVASEKESPADSVLNDPHVWFDTQHSGTNEQKSSNVHREKNKDHSKPSTKKDGSKSGSKSNVQFANSGSSKEGIDVRPFAGISSVLSSWRTKESNTLPRCKAERGQNSKTNSHNTVGSSKADWSKVRSQTVNEKPLVSGISNNLEPEPSVRDTRNSSVPTTNQITTETEDSNENIVVVKDLVKQYHQQVIVPGEKEVEEMKESKLRRSKKKKEKEKMKVQLQRKLSLRNLDVEEEGKSKNKLNRSVSYESVQRGTVKQLISLFNVSK